MRRRSPPGTRFRLFPEYASGYAEPEIVTLSLPAGSVGSGPSDDEMHAVNPLLKADAYMPPDTMPPWRGPQYAPAMPDRAGHFDHIPVDSPQFLAAHLYGSVRRTLDVWESYLGRRVVWWHASFLPQIELVPVVDGWSNAHSGPGFIETGMMPDETGREQLLALNFDVVGHETGHAILFSQVGVPPPDKVTAQYLAFHESFSDMIGLIAALNFRSVTSRLLAQTGGNLYVLNLVNRLGKLSDHAQVRIADNTTTMEDVAGLALQPDGNWTDPWGQNRNQHALGEPLTGAVFDILVEIFQDGLVRRGAIAPDRDPRGWTRAAVDASFDALHGESQRALARFESAFHAAIGDARDIVGSAMAHAMLASNPETLSFERVAARMLEAAAAQGQGPILRALMDHFLWRGIDPRPYLTIAVARDPMRRLDRTRRLLCATEPLPPRDCGCGDPRAFIFARRLMPHAHREQTGPPDRRNAATVR
jgi:hypothetical protein